VIRPGGRTHWECRGGEYIELRGPFCTKHGVASSEDQGCAHGMRGRDRPSRHGALEAPLRRASSHTTPPSPHRRHPHQPLLRRRRHNCCESRSRWMRRAMPWRQPPAPCRGAITNPIPHRMQKSHECNSVIATNFASPREVPVRVSPQVRAGGEQRRCRSSRSACGWSPRAIRVRSTDYARASARPTASLTPCARPPLHCVCCRASHRSVFASRSLHPGG
jgi:hypothetical protein